MDRAYDPSRAQSSRFQAACVLFLALLGPAACGGPPPGDGTSEARAAALSPTSAAVPADTSHAGRATVDAAGAARFRALAAQERQLVKTYGKRTGAVSATTDWYAKLKATAEARASAADQIAARYQVMTDYHLAATTQGAAQ
jgi:hypothetical protein